MNKLIIFALLMVCQVICCFALSIIPTFFPPYATKKGISYEIIGFIFISNPLGGIIASVIIGKILTAKNRFTFMIFGLIVQSIGLFLFSITYYQDDPTWIIVTAISARFVNGIATQSFITPLYAYIPILFPESTEQKINIAEFFSTIGYLVGPLAGSILFTLGGYLLPFIFFGTLALVIVPIIGYYFFRFNQHQSKVIQEQNTQTFDDDQKYLSFQQNMNNQAQTLNEDSLNYLEVFTHYRVVILTMTAFVVNFMFFYFVPVIADFFLNQYGSTPLEIGYYFTILPFGYLVNSVISAYYIKHKTLQIFIGSLIMGVAAFFLGPDQTITSVTHHLFVCWIALFVMGYTAAFLQIFCIPVLNEYLYGIYPNRILACSNMSSALFNIGVCMGEISGPPFAGFMVKYYGYDRAYSILGIVILTFSILYIPLLCQDIPSKNDNSRDIRQAKVIISMQQPIMIDPQ